MTADQHAREVLQAVAKIRALEVKTATAFKDYRNARTVLEEKEREHGNADLELRNARTALMNLVAMELEGHNGDYDSVIENNLVRGMTNSQGSPTGR